MVTTNVFTPKTLSELYFTMRLYFNVYQAARSTPLLVSFQSFGSITIQRLFEMSHICI